MGFESKVKNCFFYGLINYVQFLGFVESINVGLFDKYEVVKRVNFQDFGKRMFKDFGERMLKVLDLLYIFISLFYDWLKEKVYYILNVLMERNDLNESFVFEFRSLSINLEVQIEMCMIVVDFFNEVKYYVGQEIFSVGESLVGFVYCVEENWVLIFYRILFLLKILIV